MEIDALVNGIKTYRLDEGDALFLAPDGSIDLGREGCQPSGSLCLAIGPVETWSLGELAEIREAIDEWTSQHARVDDMASLAAARAYLGERDLTDEGDDEWTYYAAETRSRWRVTTDDMIDLGARMLRGERDAYSLWCADTTAREEVA